MEKTAIAIPRKLYSRKDEITRDFLQLVQRHISDLQNGSATRRYHSSDFAKLLFIHPRHLTNTIKLTTGKSPCEIMEDNILAEVQKMLAHTTLSIAGIGYKFAYDDPTNFTKFFKGLTGITPLRYRKSFHNPG